MGAPCGPPIPLLLLLLQHPVTPHDPRSPLLPRAAHGLGRAGFWPTAAGSAPSWTGAPFQQKSRLWLSHNGIGALEPLIPASGRSCWSWTCPHNRLQELPPALPQPSVAPAAPPAAAQPAAGNCPPGFFANATALQILRLEGNPPAPPCPPTAFQASLQLLAVPCRCDVVGTILAPCTCSGCAAPQCHCLTAHHNFVNVTDFHRQQCRHNVGLVAGLAGAAAGVAVLVLGTAAVCYWRRKAATGAASVGWGKWEPAGAHGQPRYISRAMETGTTDATAALDYENVFVNPCTVPAAAPGWMPGWQEEQHSPQVLEDDDYFLESEASPRDQPIYANTQSASEDIYIVPDK
ncbi:uncharacterized protein LOC130148611 [Falco biarmicus]|uniref:uncharacterized protein LOC130148611 n=1 Tax=Falco biarmicus TaxID=345155 RepID=UPI0024BCAE67|nr:uncharacterized protein LOC130148611 [Falco biarmicus]